MQYTYLPHQDGPGNIENIGCASDQPALPAGNTPVSTLSTSTSISPVQAQINGNLLESSDSLAARVGPCPHSDPGAEDSDTESEASGDSEFSSDAGFEEDLLGLNEGSAVQHEDAPHSINSAPNPILEALDNDIVDPSIDNQDLPTSQTITIPPSLVQLQNALLGSYTPPIIPSSTAKLTTSLSNLTRSEIISLEHYLAWSQSNGTVKAYKKHAEVLKRATNMDVLSLHRARKLASKMVSFSPQKIEMCPRSCVAFTGPHANAQFCPECGQARYRLTKSGRPKSRAHYQYLPLTPSIQAMYASPKMADHLRYRDRRLKEVLGKTGQPQNRNNPDVRKYSDYADGIVHQIHYEESGLFKDETDVALAISTDGAQLTMKKQSNCWLLIIVILNLPPEIRYKTENVIINLSIPGPNSPVDIESFLYPLFEELARAAEGIWLWDAMKEGFFLSRFYCCMGLGDMLGSAKISGMAGHTAVYGDRFSKVKGARTSLGTKAQYYPISPPENDTLTLNPGRPPVDLTHIPIRSEAEYWQTIIQLDTAKNPTARAKIVRRTGVSRLPLCAASRTFLHPVFFPIDPFHLFYENCMTFIWDTWVSSKEGDLIHLPGYKLIKLGALIEGANKTLPPALSGPIRNTQTKRNSQYKVFEWMAVLHWYIVPIGVELGFNTLVLQNFAQFVGIIEFAMTPIPRTEHELEQLQKDINRFLLQYEQLYVQGKPNYINRMRLCIFQLIHIPRHIKWNGSIRVGSQATVERQIGEMSHRIRSKKSPFANLANQIYERELIRILLLHFPALSNEGTSSNTRPSMQYHCMQKHTWTKKARRAFESHIDAILECLDRGGEEILVNHSTLADSVVQRWGKLQLPNKRVLKSTLSDGKLGDLSTSSRQYRWFEAENLEIEDGTRRAQSSNLIFGEAIAFYEVKFGEKRQIYVVYTPLVERSELFGLYTRGKWESDVVRALDVSCIRDIVGIWMLPSSDRVYILRKHPGLSLLTAEELGQTKELQDDDHEDETGGEGSKGDSGFD